MKIKNPILAAMLGKLGVEVKAELTVEDVNGTSHTFPDISDVAEIAEGVAIASPDGTYVVADGENTITIVVLGGLVTAYELTTPEVEASTEASEEVLAVLEAVVEANVKANAAIVALQTELKALKVSLKHEGTEQAPAAAAGKAKPQFKIIG